MNELSAQPRSRLRSAWVYGVFWLACVVLTELIYFRAGSYPFVLDDYFHWVLNPTVKSLSGLGTIWTSNYWESYGQGGLYRPLLKTLWLVELVFLGGSRTAILVVAAAGHALNATLVARIARRAGAAPVIAGAAAVWFLLHAAHSEVLLTAVGQGEIGSVALGLLALLLVFPGGPTGSGRLVGFVVCAVASTLVKEQGFVAAALGAAALWLNHGFSGRQRIATLSALALGLGLVVLVRFAVLGSFGPVGGFTVPLGSGLARWLVPLWLAGRYVALAFAPLDLSVHYDWLEHELPVGIGDPHVWLGAVAGALSIVWIWRAWRRGNDAQLIVVLAAWLPLAPFLGIVRIGSLFGERHIYHALAGVALVLACGCTAAAGTPAARRRIAAAALALGLWSAALGARAWARVPVWQSSERLWATAFEEHPSSAFAATSLALIYMASDRYALARQLSERALEADPNFAMAHLTLGDLELRVSRFESAIPHYEAAAASPVRRHAALLGLARAHLGLGDIERASAIQRALAADSPEDAMVRQLGVEISAKSPEPPPHGAEPRRR